MDILVDLIIYLIKAFSTSRQPQQRVAPPSQQEIDRQKAEVERRIREMQNALVQKKRQAPPGKQARRVTREVKPASAPLPMPAPRAPRWSAPQVNAAATSTATSRRTAASQPRKRIVVPLLLGEILGPPLALRKPEF